MNSNLTTRFLNTCQVYVQNQNKKTIYKYEYGIISKSVYVYHENVHKYDLCFVLFAISLKLYNPPVFVMYIFFWGLKAAIA